jgi:hypothetical protein
VFAGIRGVTGALCISLLAFSLSGPPFVHVALLVLLLLGARSQALACLLLLAVAAALGALYARGLRLVVRTDAAGRPGVALIRCAFLKQQNQGKGHAKRATAAAAAACRCGLTIGVRMGQAGEQRFE